MHRLDWQLKAIHLQITDVILDRQSIVQYKLKICLKMQCCKPCRQVKFKATMPKWPVQKQAHRTTQNTPNVYHYGLSLLGVSIMYCTTTHFFAMPGERFSDGIAAWYITCIRMVVTINMTHNQSTLNWTQKAISAMCMFSNQMWPAR